MPELPEVEEAVQRLRGALSGRTIVKVTVLHRTLRAQLSDRARRALRGARIDRVERRGKHQLIHLADGRLIHVHFRMAGDWQLVGGGELPRHARLVMELDDGSRVALVDSRALAKVALHAAGDAPALGLGPEATDASIPAGAIHVQLRTRRSPIKVVLLDQRLIAGVGNIYAAEALWDARIDPRRGAATLTIQEVRRLLRSVRTVLARAQGERYYRGSGRFAVYDREGEPCNRCGTAIARVTQAGRSTYFCPDCQAVVSRAPRAARP